jgi:uncharacterized protein (DUF1697 family)
MNVFVALLRAINVGGTGKLPMRELVQLCETAGFQDVKTYIQSGNVLFKSKLPEAKVQAKLEKALAEKMGKPHGVIVRTRAELDAIIQRNPFAKAPPNRVIVLLLAEPPPRNALASVVIPGNEVLKLSGRDLYIHYPDGMGQSKLQVPLSKLGTARNLNTITKLAALAGAMETAR